MHDGVFPRVFIAGADDSEARRDALALVAALGGRPEAVTARVRADLIVTGSAADGAPGRTALDPDQRALLDGARCPVAVAPRGLARRDGYAVRRIDVGIDGGRGAGAALATAARLASGHGARLRLIAVAALDGAVCKADPGEADRLARHLESAHDGLARSGVETALREGVPDRVLLGLAHEADLLALGSRAAYGDPGRVALGDVAAGVLRGAPCPTLVVPAP